MYDVTESEQATFRCSLCGGTLGPVALRMIKETDNNISVIDDKEKKHTAEKKFGSKMEG